MLSSLILKHYLEFLDVDFTTFGSAFITVGNIFIYMKLNTK